MGRRWLSPTLGAVAAILVLAAGAVQYVAAPSLRRLPADLDKTIALEGTADYADMAAIKSWDLRHLYRKKVKVNINERVRVVKTSGNTAVVEDSSDVLGPDRKSIRTTKHTFAVHRVTMFPAPAPAGSTVGSHKGLVLGFPLTPKPQNYPYWDMITQTTVTATYQKTETISGRRTYVYLVKASGPVKDPEVLKSVPKNAPVTLSSVGQTQYWIDSASSMVLKILVQQQVQATVKSLSWIPKITVFGLEAQLTPAASKAALGEASTAGRGLLMLDYGPLALVGLGGLLAVLTLGRIGRARIRGKRASESSAGSPSPPQYDPPAYGASAYGAQYEPTYDTRGYGG